MRSVANLTRRDGEEFLVLAPEVPVRVYQASPRVSGMTDEQRRIQRDR